jgi:hypothetical protein
MSKRALRFRLLAKQIATLLVFSSPGAMAFSTWNVNTCDEGNFGNPGAHTGTLRFAAMMAGTGDTIDLSQLTCSTISLKSGAIVLTQDDITLQGPGRDQLVISGKYGIVAEHDRVFLHSGSGSLKIRDLSIQDGYLDANAPDRLGGCIRSYGSVVLDDVAISNCRTYAPNASGGAIVTANSLWLLNSTLSFNEAGAVDGVSSNSGGGAYVFGDLLAINSTISYNSVREGDGGGAVVRGNTYAYYSVIDENSAKFDGGGIVTYGNLTLANSTVSGNSAQSFFGALEALGPVALIENSTITLNIANGVPGVGVRPYQAMTVSLQSSMITNNTTAYGAAIVENDLDRCCAAAQATITFDGARNIVRTPAITLPAGIATTGVCPLLGPLRDNGGPTLTHALLSKSPGIDEGDGLGFSFDERGFYRISGNGADIGAYEIDQDDVVFNNSFDGCP